MLTPRPPISARRSGRSVAGDDSCLNERLVVDAAGRRFYFKGQPDRPHTHCGSLARPNAEEDSCATALEVPACGSAGAVALGSLTAGCRSCIKLRLRLENEERARVKVQEQCATLQAEILRLHRSRLRGDVPKTAGGDPQISVDTAEAQLSCETSLCVSSPSRGRATSMGAGVVEEVGHSLETYKREVELLREALRSGEAREAALRERQRQVRDEHEAAKMEWEAQVAGLVCEVQDLETQNREMERALNAVGRLRDGSLSTSTTASSGGTTSGPSSDAGVEDISQALLTQQVGN